MTAAIFFWYVLPLVGGAITVGWLLYDWRVQRDRLHPGE
jgi:hypothetical protein